MGAVEGPGERAARHEVDDLRAALQGGVIGDVVVHNVGQRRLVGALWQEVLGVGIEENALAAPHVPQDRLGLVGVVGHARDGRADEDAAARVEGAAAHGLGEVAVHAAHHVLVFGMDVHGAARVDPDAAFLGGPHERRPVRAPEVARAEAVGIGLAAIAHGAHVEFGFGVGVQHGGQRLIREQVGRGQVVAKAEYAFLEARRVLRRPVGKDGRPGAGPGVKGGIGRQGRGRSHMATALTCKALRGG